MTGSHEVRGSIPLSSTNEFNDLEKFLFFGEFLQVCFPACCIVISR